MPQQWEQGRGCRRDLDKGRQPPRGYKTGASSKKPTHVKVRGLLSLVSFPSPPPEHFELGGKWELKIRPPDLQEEVSPAQKKEKKISKPDSKPPEHDSTWSSCKATDLLQREPDDCRDANLLTCFQDAPQKHLSSINHF